MPAPDPSYLRPYLRAVRRHGPGFRSLLWSSPQTQAARFDALVRLCNFAGQRILDAGCGHADLLDYLLQRNIRPAHYVGMEAVGEFAEAARSRHLPGAQIVEADFIREPARLLVGADVIVFCGSLNTLDRTTFHSTLTAACHAAGRSLAFNFLSAPARAAAGWLTWHPPADIAAFLSRFPGTVSMLEDYLDGDCTAVLQKL